MSEDTKTAEPLNVPAAGPAHFAKNFIRLAVCELRFPTLFELSENPRPPVDFAKALRKEYPTYELLNDVNLNPGGVAQAIVHSFRSKKGRWAVTLRAAAVSLETSNYDAFGEFVDRLSLILEAAKITIDSDFFTRVGLRYINTVPFDRSTICEWVNPALVRPLGDGTFGDADEHLQLVRGRTNEGGYTFRHRLLNATPGGTRDYELDFDFYSEDVPVTETIETVKRLHDLEFSMFMWSLGPKAKVELGSSTPKADR